jgi:circadian clock protein KaiB
MAQADLFPMTGPILRLYIAGNSPSSRQAQQNLKHLQMLMKAEAGRVEVIDVLTCPGLAEKESVLATPTLCYEHLGRRRRIIGDLGDPKRILAFLGIEMKGDAA